MLIVGKGWFQWTLSGLVNADPVFVAEYGTNERAPDINEILEVLWACDHVGVARVSRRGWRTLDIPGLGIVQWKNGVNFRNGSNYCFLRINGKVILQRWQGRYGKRGGVEWTPANTEIDDHVKESIERRLGVLN